MAAPELDADDSRRAPELAVILCVHNGAATVRDQLEALTAQEWDEPWEIVVVDHASTDDTPTILAGFAAAHPRVRVVRADARPGLSHARNVGVASTGASAVAFCDDDDRVADGWVAAMGRALHEHALVACRFEWDHRAADAPTSFAGGSFQRDGLAKVFGYPVAAGVAGWQRWLWNELGGNDESLTFTGEDFDMSIRAYLAHGVEPFFEPGAVYHIARRAGLRANFRQARRYGRASVVLFDRYGRGRADRRAELGRACKQWLWLARHPLDLRDTRAGTVWVRNAGVRVGRLEQSLRSRVLWL